MKNAKPWDICERTKEFAIRVIRLFVALPKTDEAQVPGKQMLRSGTSVGAHTFEKENGAVLMPN